MRVAYLYIIAIGDGMLNPDEETTAVCNGLYTKYAGRSGPTALLGINGEDLEVTVQLWKSTGDIPINPGIRRAGSYSATEPPAVQVPAKRRGVGVYLAIHGMGQAGGLLKAGEVVDLLVSVIPEAQRRDLEKIALIQCFAASKQDGKLDNKSIQEIADAPPLIQLLSELRKRGMSPMLAGWDGFVSAAPHKPKNEDEVEQDVKTKAPNAPLKAPWQVVQDLSTIAGRKIVHHPHHYGKVTQVYRNKNKHYYQIDAEGRLRVDLPGWSDK